MNQTGVYGTGSLRQACMKGDFAWDTVTSEIVSHHRTAVAGRHAVRDPTNKRKSVPLSASTLSTPAGPVTHRTEEVAG
jgi:hypothetical protein